jgi:RNA polymerase sigma-70 factor (ECF subfamily)
MIEDELFYIRQAQMGDKQAFTKLVSGYDKKLFQMISTMLNNHQDAQDVYQESLLKAYTKLKDFDFNSSFNTWLTRIAINCSMNKRRYNQRKKWLLFTEKETLNGFTVSVEENRTSEQGYELKEELKKALETLSARQRMVFILKHMQGYRIKEIAGLLEIAEGTVKNTLFRAVQKLQKEMSHLYVQS